MGEELRKVLFRTPNAEGFDDKENAPGMEHQLFRPDASKREQAASLVLISGL